jgi:DNA-binding IclR family transcriptional regulator
MDTSKPVEKTIAVMEYLSTHPKEVFSLERLSRECSIPKTTLLRILNTFLKHGYITKTSSKGYICNFLFTKEIPLDADHLGKIEETLKKLVEECRQSVEILIVNGKNLQWYDKLEHPDLSIRVVAQVGFKRALYELDAPSRAYLKFIGMDEVMTQFDTSSFYTASSEYRELSWLEAENIIEESDSEGVEYDLAGNRNGVRRFAIVISSSAREFLYLLCIAEPALLMDYEKAHIQKNISLLQQYKQELMQLTR